MVAAGAGSAELLRWAAITDLFGYYLATGVVAYVVWAALRPLGRAVADLATLSALGYVLAGGAAATGLAFVGPRLMDEYAAGGDPAALGVAFGVLVEVVFSAIWQFLDAWLLAGGWVGIGALTLGVPRGFARVLLTASAEGPAARDPDNLAGDVARLLRGEEDVDRCELGGLSRAAERRVLAEL